MPKSITAQCEVVYLATSSIKQFVKLIFAVLSCVTDNAIMKSSQLYSYLIISELKKQLYVTPC